MRREGEEVEKEREDRERNKTDKREGGVIEGRGRKEMGTEGEKNWRGKEREKLEANLCVVPAGYVPGVAERYFRVFLISKREIEDHTYLFTVSCLFKATLT